jgi:hypothetical protein
MMIKTLNSLFYKKFVIVVINKYCRLVFNVVLHLCTVQYERPRNTILINVWGYVVWHFSLNTYNFIKILLGPYMTSKFLNYFIRRYPVWMTCAVWYHSDSVIPLTNSTASGPLSSSMPGRGTILKGTIASLKEQCHEILDPHFVHQSTPSKGPDSRAKAVSHIRIRIRIRIYFTTTCTVHL